MSDSPAGEAKRDDVPAPGDAAPPPTPAEAGPAAPGGAGPGGPAPGGNLARSLVKASPSGRFDLGELLDERSGARFARPPRDASEDTQQGLKLTWEESDSHFRLRPRPDPDARPTETASGVLDAPALEAPPPPAPVDHPRRAIWLLVALLVITYFTLGGTFQRPVGRELLDLNGALRSHDAFGEPWRLVLASFLHADLAVLVFTALMTIVLGGEVERRAGAGSTLFLFVVVGGALNAARTFVEGARSLLGLAGGWPAGLALGGAALALTLASPRSPGRRPFNVGSLLLIYTMFLYVLAAQAGVWGAGVQALLFLSVGVGLVGGLALAFRRAPAGPDEPTQGGCALGLAAALALGLSHVAAVKVERRAQPPLPPGTGAHSAGAPAEVPALEPRRLADLKVQVALPADWTERPTSVTVTCPQCKARQQVPGATAPDPAPVPCPSGCGGQVQPAGRHSAMFFDAALVGWNHRVDVWARPKDQFDAADTLAGNQRADFVEGKGALTSPTLLEDRPFDGAAGRGHVLVLRGQADGQAYVHRRYYFVGPRRTMYLDGFVRDDGDPAAAAYAAALFDAIAASVRELE